MQHYSFYILFSSVLNRYYVGYAENIEDRLRKHLANHTGFTGRAKDWIIAYTETFKDKTQALAREKQIKSWKSRRMIESLIKKG